MPTDLCTQVSNHNLFTKCRFDNNFDEQVRASYLNNQSKLILTQISVM